MISARCLNVADGQTRPAVARSLIPMGAPQRPPAASLNRTLRSDRLIPPRKPVAADGTTVRRADDLFISYQILVHHGIELRYGGRRCAQRRLANEV